MNNKEELFDGIVEIPSEPTVEANASEPKVVEMPSFGPEYNVPSEPTVEETPEVNVQEEVAEPTFEMPVVEEPVETIISEPEIVEMPSFGPEYNVPSEPTVEETPEVNVQEEVTEPTFEMPVVEEPVETTTSEPEIVEMPSFGPEYNVPSEPTVEEAPEVINNIMPDFELAQPSVEPSLNELNIELPTSEPNYQEVLTDVQSNVQMENTQVASSNNVDIPVTPIEQNIVNNDVLQELNKDTDMFVNPDLVVNPSVKELEEQPEILDLEEPKVDYKKMENKKKYGFMALVFGIIIVFILLLPVIISILGI